MDMQAFQKLGTTPQAVNAYRGLETTIQSTTNQARVAADSAARLAETYKKDALANGADITADPQYAQLVKASQAASARYQQYLQQSKQFGQGFQQFANQVLHKGGAPNTWTVPKSAGTAWKFVPTATLHNKPIGLNKDGTGYVYADGTPAH